MPQRMKKFGLNKKMPIVFISMMPQNVGVPCLQAVITVPHKKHFLCQKLQVRVSNKLRLESLIPLFPTAAPTFHYVWSNMHWNAVIICDRDVEASISTTVPVHKILLQSSNVWLQNRANQGKGYHTAQWNKKLTFLGRWLEVTTPDEGVGVHL